jgi:hypothetical protein
MSETETTDTSTGATAEDRPDDRLAERFVIGFGVMGLLSSLVAVVMIFDHLGDLRDQQRPDHHSTSTHDGGQP